MNDYVRKTLEARLEQLNEQAEGTAFQREQAHTRAAVLTEELQTINNERDALKAALGRD